MRRARAAGVGLLVALAFAPGTAGANEVSAGELQRLARTGAVEELRAVTSVDGQPVDLDAALGDARGAELEARVRALAEAAPAPALRDARGQAQEILAQARFRGAEVPGPFRGLVDWLEGLVPRGVIEWIDDRLPGGRSVVWVALAALLFAAGWFVARRLLTRRIVGSEEATFTAAGAEADPRALEREADAAEARGELEAALRLRFRAGLLRLDRRGTIEFRPSISTHEVRRAVRSPDFDRLAETFDDVVYGGRDPRAEDVREARERWPEVTG